MHVDSINITTGVINKHEFYKVEIHCPNLSPFHSIFMVRRSGIICGPIWGSFPVRGSFAVQVAYHFRSGIICSSSWGSFAGLYTASFFESAISWDHFLTGHHKEISSFYVMIYKRIAEEHHLRSLLATRKVLIYICSSKFYSLF